MYSLFSSLTKPKFDVATHTFEECQDELNKSIRYDHFLFEDKQRPIRNKVDMTNIKKDLEEVGYCVIDCVTNPYHIYKTFLEDLCDKKNIDMEAIDDVRLMKPNHFLEASRGIVSHDNGMTHSKSLWTIRSHPEIVEFMAKLYECEPHDVTVSFDTMGIRYAPELLRLLDYDMNLYDDTLIPHIDQRFEFDFQEHYQCIYAITDSINEEDGGLFVYPGTHKIHGNKLQRLLYSEPDRDFIVYPPNFFDLFSKAKSVKLSMKMGCIVLWDSRLLHGSSPIDMNREKEVKSYNMYDMFLMNRTVSYMCYAKKEDTKDEYDRNMIYNFGYLTNHMVKRPRIVYSKSEILKDFINDYHRSLI
jgi:hypothetical protein